MKIIKFKNGKYGIRQGWRQFCFYDFKDKTWWAGRTFMKYRKDCQATLMTAIQAREDMQDMGTPI